MIKLILDIMLTENNDNFVITLQCKENVIFKSNVCGI